MKNEIVFLSRSLPFHRIGGMEIFAWDLAHKFSMNGHRVRIITTAIPEIDDEFVKGGVRVVPLKGTSPGNYSKKWWRLSKEYFENHCIRSTAAVLSVSAGAFGILSIKNKLPHVPFVMQAHGTSLGEFVSKWRSRKVISCITSLKNLYWMPKDLINYPKFDAVVAVGDRVYKDLTSLPVKWTLNRNNVHLIRNGIDTSVFHPSSEVRRDVRKRLGIREDAPVITTASRLHVQKGIANSLRAFSVLVKEVPNAVYLVCGDGPERSSLERLSDVLEIRSRVRFLGGLGRSDLAKVLQASDVFLFLTERVEGLPLNVLEALSSGVPCVISNHMKVFESKYVAAVSPRNPFDVSKSVIRFLNDEKLEVKSALPDEYTLDYAAQRYLHLLKVN